MSIRDLTDEQLQSFVNNYRRAGVTEGGKFTLAELLLEDSRRVGAQYSGREVTEIILSLASSANDGLITYKDLWRSLYPEEDWKGNHSIKEIGKPLEAAVHYCIRNNLPIVTALVVRSDKRSHSDAAVQNMFKACQERGVETGLVPAVFIEQQIETAKALDRRHLPAEG